MKKITLLVFLLSISFSFSQVLTEDFEGGLTIPATWTNDDIAGGGETWTIATGGEAVGFAPPNTLYYTDTMMSGNYALFDSDGFGGLGPAEEAALTSPVFDCSGLTAVQLSFNHFFTAGYGGQGFVEVYDGSVWQQVAFYTGADQNASSFGAVVLDVSSDLAGVANAQVRFRWVGDYAWGWAFDDVIVEEGPSCLVPSGFAASTVTTTSFGITWTDTNPGTPTWEIEWGTAGFVQGSGVPVTGLTTAEYTFPGLTADTTYAFYIRTNCGGTEGDSEWVGPVTFTTLFDCSTYGLPYSENWTNINAYTSCYVTEDTNTDGLSWLFNDVNDVDGDGNNDNFVNIFPQAAGVAKDDWLFTPAISGTANAEYTVTITYNAVDFQAAANESFDLVITDTPMSTTLNQTTIGSYSGITQSGVFGDMGGNDLITQAYTSTATYTAPADGDFHVAIHATTTAANSDVFFILSIDVTETLSVDEFDSNNFTYSYNKTTDQLTIESSNLPFDGIELYSILGQKVVSEKLSQTNEVIDLSRLTDGVYLATVTINGSSKTFKLIKQ